MAKQQKVEVPAGLREKEVEYKNKRFYLRKLPTSKKKSEEAKPVIRRE